MDDVLENAKKESGEDHVFVHPPRKDLLTWNPKGNQCNNYQLRHDWLHAHDSKIVVNPHSLLDDVGLVGHFQPSRI